MFFSRAAGFAYARARLEKAHLPAGQATVVHKLVADRAARPSAAEDGLIAIQALPADLAGARLDPQQHRLPFTSRFANTHSVEV